MEGPARIKAGGRKAQDDGGREGSLSLRCRKHTTAPQGAPIPSVLNQGLGNLVMYLQSPFQK